MWANSTPEDSRGRRGFCDRKRSLLLYSPASNSSRLITHAHSTSHAPEGPYRYLLSLTDIPGCKVCIQKHSATRERLTTGKAKTKAQRLAREMISMLADPFSHVGHDVHGEWMLNYSEMIADHQQNLERTGQRPTIVKPRISRSAR